MKKAAQTLLYCLLPLLCGAAPSVKGDVVDYRAVVGCEEGFVAVRSDGRIDRIAPSGEVVGSVAATDKSLNTLLSCGETLVAAGEGGVLFVVRENGKPQRIENPTKATIRSLTLYRGRMVAGTDGGSVLTSDGNGNFSVTQLELRGNIVSVSGGALGCYGVTDRGEIIRSDDLATWEITDFNALYRGYYPPRSFTAVCVTDHLVAVTGESETGIPVLSLSTGGDVWTERNLDYTDPSGMPATLSETPHAIIYEAQWDRFIVACDGGRVMSVPGCSHCNALFQMPTRSNLTALAQNGGRVLVVGEELAVAPFGF
jgi:hypothetical protein